MRYKISGLLLAGLICLQTYAQEPDTTGICGERKDNLEAAVFTSRQDGNYISKGKQIRTEVISSAGLRKLACCSLAESFENSASVTVGYSDAVTGARQIRLLGLSGVYTQMLDESRPIMRGISSPFGLSYVPGQWMESIQIAKGSTSVTSGVESITGQINIEHRKPTETIPLFVNFSTMNDTKTDLVVSSAHQFNDKLSTILLGYVTKNFKEMDMNCDGYLDQPMQLQLNFSNRWYYYAESGVQVRFGLRALSDRRQGGMSTYDKDTYTPSGAWGSDIRNNAGGAYLKVGVPLSPDNAQNFAIVADYSLQKMDSYFGARSYNATQHSFYTNLLYSNAPSENHQFTLGLNATVDLMDEDFKGFSGRLADESTLGFGGAFAEYTYTSGEKFTFTGGASILGYMHNGVKLVPRMSVKYSPSENLVIRASAGRGLRFSMPVSDNIGMMSTSKDIDGNIFHHTLEDAWTLGGNATWYIGQGKSTYFSLDYFHTDFSSQAICDREAKKNTISLYNLDGRSFTNTVQGDFNCEPFKRFTVTLTGRYTDSRVELQGQGLVESPLVSRFKGVLNLQYATNMSKWIFDATASVNGPCRLYSFMDSKRSPSYPLYYCQVTRKFRGLDVYAGVENIADYRQKDVILGSILDADGRISGASPDFDASCVWAPLMGRSIYVGLRLTIWR